MPIQTPLRALHEAAGATFGEYFGCELPARFTNSREEYYFARKTAAVADKNYRAFFNFTGPDRARYLNAILTNNIKDLQPGQGISSLLLNPQGHIMAEIEVYGLADRILAATYAMIRERTAATMDKFIIMDDVVMEDVTEQLGTISIEGPLSAKIIYVAWRACVWNYCPNSSHGNGNCGSSMPHGSPISGRRTGRGIYCVAGIAAKTLASRWWTPRERMAAGRLDMTR